MTERSAPAALPGLGPETQPADPPSRPSGQPNGRVVRVLPDVVGIDKVFDYLAPDGAEVSVGDLVRIKLGGRRVGGWIIEVDVEPAPGIHLVPLTKLSGRGPQPELVELTSWAAWRWAGRRVHFLRSASPPANVASLPAAGRPAPTASEPGGPDTSDDGLLARALAAQRAVLRLPPAADRYPVVRAAVEATGPVDGGHTLILVPSVTEAQVLGRRLRRDGVLTAILAGESGVAGAGQWARARAGAVVVGARAAAWAPVERLGRVVVLDEHDEAYQEESSPTWHARDVVIERARRADAPCLLVSPTPTLEALAWGHVVVPSRAVERAGWPRIELVDQRDLDPTLGPLFSPNLVRLVRAPGRVLCILNRTGRVRVLACGSCATLARCERCDAAVSLADAEPSRDERGGGELSGGKPAEELACGRCGARRPVVCMACGGARFKNLRLGVGRAREELEALVGEPVTEVTGASTPPSGPTDARVSIGTEALLHRVHHADAVAFLDFDQELLALRYRAGEQALGLLARAARVVRRAEGRHGRLLVQTRTPEHPALQSALHADPSRLVEAELPLRRTLDLPPTSALAVVSGAAAPAFMDGLGAPADLIVQGPVDGAWRLRAPTHDVLCHGLAAVRRPPGRLRIEVDPLDI